MHVVLQPITAITRIHTLKCWGLPKYIPRITTNCGDNAVNVHYQRYCNYTLPLSSRRLCSSFLALQCWYSYHIFIISIPPSLHPPPAEHYHHYPAVTPLQSDRSLESSAPPRLLGIPHPQRWPDRCKAKWTHGEHLAGPNLCGRLLFASPPTFSCGLSSSFKSLSFPSSLFVFFLFFFFF